MKRIIFWLAMGFLLLGPAGVASATGSSACDPTPNVQKPTGQTWDPARSTVPGEPNHG